MNKDKKPINKDALDKKQADIANTHHCAMTRPCNDLFNGDLAAGSDGERLF